MYLTICFPCENHHHDHCEVGKLPPPGYMGGWNCTCKCGNGKKLFERERSQPRIKQRPKLK